VQLTAYSFLVDKTQPHLFNRHAQCGSF